MAEKTVTVELRRTIAVRTPGARGSTRSYGPGVVDIPESLARSLGIKAGEGRVAPTQGRKVERAERTGRRTAAATGDADPFADWKKEDFEAEAARRNITVTRGDGKDGEPLLEDYRKALS